MPISYVGIYFCDFFLTSSPPSLIHRHLEIFITHHSTIQRDSAKLAEDFLAHLGKEKPDFKSLCAAWAPDGLAEYLTRTNDQAQFL